MKVLQNPLFICFSCRRALAPYRSSTPASFRRSYIRPSTAPRPVVDVRHIRRNPGLYEQNCDDRNYKAQSKNSWRILELFSDLQSSQSGAKELRRRQNELRRRIANASTRTSDENTQDTAADLAPVTALPEEWEDDRVSVLEESRKLKTELGGIEAREEKLRDEIERLALELPNLTSHSTPPGTEPLILEYINEHPAPGPSTSERVWRSHVHIGTELGILDFAGAATATGWGWYYLINEGALLEQALVQYALGTALRRGWTVISPPSIIYSHIAAACGFQPRDQNDEQQIYALAQTSKDQAKPPLALAGTAEIPLAAFKAKQVMEEAELPVKVIGSSRCYRAEAGGRGVDTKGLYRVHEFTKVEMFAWTMPEDPEGRSDSTRLASSGDVFDEMLSIQKEILTALGLHCRILEMPSTDLGASASRKKDIETYFPSRRERGDGWGEVTSASMCTDYQTRRLDTRVRIGRGHGLDFPHTLNGTAMAVPRVIAAILENNWNERDCSVRIPDVLRPWMGQKEYITKNES